MGKSIVDTIQYVAEKMCADYCKYYARVKRYKPFTKKYVEKMDYMCKHICTKCPINNIY